MRGRTLLYLLDGMRAEARMSLNPAQNAQDREAQVKLLQRVQSDYWEDFDWPHLRVEREVAIQAGQRYFDVPDDIPLDRLEKIEVFSSGIWQRLVPDITARQYAAFDSDLDQRSWPPRCWKIYEGELVEIWPVPLQDADPATREGTLKFTGIRKLRRLVDDDDQADLDDRLIILSAAAERLSASGAKDAQLKLQKASQLYRSLRSGLTPNRRFRMFGAGRPERCDRRPAVAGNYQPPQALSPTYQPDPTPPTVIPDAKEF